MLEQLIAELEVTIVACAKKDQHMQRYGLGAIDPYHLSLNVLIERFCFTLSKCDRGTLIAEARDKTLDRLLDLAWQDVLASGTRYVQAIDVTRRIESLTLKTKQDTVAGLEIADAIVTPIARSILNRQSRIDMDIIQSKMRKDHQGNVQGYGLVILPKK